jgi:hypothetical protein
LSILGSLDSWLRPALNILCPDVTTALSIPHGRSHASKENVLRYLPGTIDMRLALRGGTAHSLQLTCFADADWANDNNTRKSRSGYLFTLGRGPMSYKYEQQTCAAQSTCEAEYYSEGNATKEGLHLHQLVGGSSTPPSPKPPPFGRTTKAPSRTPKMPWSTRRPSV